MLQSNSKKPLIISIVAVVSLLIIVGIFALTRPSTEPQAIDRPDVTKQQTEAETSEKAAETAAPVDKETPTEPTLDPETVATADIAPMGIRVSYVKGIGGFEYQILRTLSGTQYVSFTTPELVGTKCTNDAGAFASIIERPADDESATIAKRTVVGGVSYGLSLADDTCTSNPDLLKTYQSSFSDAFSLLTPIE